jgi:hypothetical protein
VWEPPSLLLARVFHLEYLIKNSGQNPTPSAAGHAATSCCPLAELAIQLKQVLMKKQSSASPVRSLPYRVTQLRQAVMKTQSSASPVRGSLLHSSGRLL